MLHQMKFNETTSTEDETRICRQFLGYKCNYNYFDTANFVDQSSNGECDTPKMCGAVIVRNKCRFCTKLHKTLGCNPNS